FPSAVIYLRLLVASTQRPPIPTLFPYTTLFRSRLVLLPEQGAGRIDHHPAGGQRAPRLLQQAVLEAGEPGHPVRREAPADVRFPGEAPYPATGHVDERHRHLPQR